MAALEHEPPRGRVPHFELVFFLTMEAFGRLHPTQRHYRQWDQMTENERALHRNDVADLHVTVAERYEHAGMLFYSPDGWKEEDTRLSLQRVREISGMRYLTALHGDATYSIPDGKGMMDFAARLADHPREVKDTAQRRVEEALEKARRIKAWGTVDAFCLCADYCFNDNPFLSPAMFDTFVTPYLAQLVAGYREMGFYVIKHTDGNIMPILDALLSTRPHALHSLDPQAGIDLAAMKRKAGNDTCLIGNVNCALLQTGSDEAVVADTRRALAAGMPGGGYVFSTSNCIYTGVPLKRYELMWNVWYREGVYETGKTPHAKNGQVEPQGNRRPNTPPA